MMAGPVEKPESWTIRVWRRMSPAMWVVLVVGVVLHVGGFFLIRVETGPLPEHDAGTPFIAYVSENMLQEEAALEEHSRLFDSAPLFIPTRWNASQRQKHFRQGFAMRRFSDFEPDIDLMAELRPSELPLERYAKVEKPMDLLHSQFRRFFETFGRTDREIEPLPDSGRVVEIVVLEKNMPGGGADRGRGRRFSVEVEADPEAEGPVTYFVRVSGEGRLIGAPTLNASSGSETFDAAVRDWITAPSTAARLPAGYLSIRVYP
ncbi:MAG: hypothetical protein ACLFS4_06390 [Opitutales bacterium]